MKYKLFTSTLMVVALGLSGCGGSSVQKEAKYPTGADRTATDGDIYAKPKSIFGSDGINFLGGKKDKDDGDGTSGIGVNSYLWRASLDTVSFMPLASADPFGGVILTDWYTPQESPDKRFKLNVFILDRQLRSDALTVKLFTQEKKGSEWVDAASSEETARTLEDTILTRARQMRVAKLHGGK